jgi:hypothetical protein
MTLYGKKTKVRYLCQDLIWRPVKKLVRFVLVDMGANDRVILMSTSLTLRPTDIIAIYGLRFKIETSFDEQKNDMGCFSYHFWTAALPKRRKWKKPEPPTDPKRQNRIEDARRATESFVCLCTIATGILSIIAFAHNREIWQRYPGWIRTLRSDIPTISTIKETLAYDFPHFLRANSHLPICAFVKSRQRLIRFLYKDVA